MIMFLFALLLAERAQLAPGTRHDLHVHAPEELCWALCLKSGCTPLLPKDDELTQTLNPALEHTGKCRQARSHGEQTRTIMQYYKPSEWL
jgi:hypothetical protein